MSHPGFICEHYLKFSKSLLCVILSLLSQKNYLEILKNQNIFDRGKGELENAKGRKHESIFTFKMASSNAFRRIFYHKQRRALFCLQDKGVAPSVLVVYIIRTASKLRSQVHFKFGFGILFPST